MYKPLSAGRRYAYRSALFATLAVVLTALAFIAAQQSLDSGLAALTGGLAVIAGNLGSARVALGGSNGSQVHGAGVAFSRLLLGIGLKWLVVVLALGLGIAAGLPIFPILIGVIVSTLAPLIIEILAAGKVSKLD